MSYQTMFGCPPNHGKPCSLHCRIDYLENLFPIAKNQFLHFDRTSRNVFLFLDKYRITKGHNLDQFLDFWEISKQKSRFPYSKIFSFMKYIYRCGLWVALQVHSVLSLIWGLPSAYYETYNIYLLQTKFPRNNVNCSISMFVLNFNICINYLPNVSKHEISYFLSVLYTQLQYTWALPRFLLKMMNNESNQLIIFLPSECKIYTHSHTITHTHIRKCTHWFFEIVPNVYCSYSSMKATRYSVSRTLFSNFSANYFTLK